MRSNKMIWAVAPVLMVLQAPLASADVCPPPRPGGGGDGPVDDCRLVYQIVCYPSGLVSTGFQAAFDGETGIVAALHGVAGCTGISGFNVSNELRNLNITRVDLGRDLVFMNSQSLRGASSALEFDENYSSTRLRVLGYPQGIDYQLGKWVEIDPRPLRPLHELLPSADRQELAERGSPDIANTILSLAGPIQRGYSGAPVLTEQGQVVAIANGGLREGTVDIGWAMPAWEISWEDYSRVEQDVTRLAGNGTSHLFGADPSGTDDLPVLYLADGGDRRGRIYELQNGRLREIYVRPSGAYSSLSNLAVSSSGTIYFSNAVNGKSLYRLNSGREENLYTHDTYLRDVEVDPLDRIYFSEATGAGGDGSIYRLESDGRASLYYRVRLDDVDGSWAGDFAFDRDGNLWLSSGNQKPANLYKVQGGEVRRVFSSGESINGFSFTSNGDILYTERNRIIRLELPSFITSEVYYSGLLHYASDVVPARR